MSGAWTGAFALRWLLVVAALGLGACDDGDGGGEGPVGGAADMALGGAGGEADAAVGEPDAALPGTLSLSVEALDFGAIGLNTTSRLEISVTHSGGGPVNITGLEGLAPPFSFSRQPPINVPAGAERALQVEFRPTAGEAYEATVTLITDNPDQAPLTLNLRGSGVVASGELVSETLDFGVLAIDQSGSATLQVRNTSNSAPLQVSGVIGVEAPFSGADNFQAREIGPGLVEDIPLLFTSSEGGLFQAEARLITNAGELPFTLQARVIDPGSLVVQDVAPAWAPVDEAVTVIIHGGPFDTLPDAIRVGARALTDLTQLDEERIQGTLPAGGEATASAEDLLDVRVEIGDQFGVLPAAFVQTPPIDQGQLLEAEDLSGPIGPEGNPWRVAIDAVPEGEVLTLQAGAVLLGAAEPLVIQGRVMAEGEEGRIVLSAEARSPGAWGGLVFDGLGDGQYSQIANAVFEYTGDAAVTIRRPTVNLTDVLIREGAGDGVRVEEGGQLLLLGARIMDMAGDAVDIIHPLATLGRLTALYARRCDWPVASYAGHFGGQPQGAGSDWQGNRIADAIGIGGALVEDTRLSNQPEGVRYQIRSPVVVGRGVTLTLASAAPLYLDGPVEVDGTLSLPMGLSLQAGAGGFIDVRGAGALQAQGGNGAEVAIRGRAPGAEVREEAWHGVRIGLGATLDARFLIVQDAGAPLEGEAQGAAIRLEGDFGDAVAVQIRDAVGAALAVDGSGQFRAFQMSGNAAGIIVSGGSGLLAGELDAPEPAIEFTDPALCAAWDTIGVLTPMGLPATDNCDEAP